MGVVAELMGVDPQVVRGYDQRGLVQPERSDGGHRRYSRRDIRRLTRALDLADEGISTAGIERILELEDQVGREGDDLGDDVGGDDVGDDDTGDDDMG